MGWDLLYDRGQNFENIFIIHDGIGQIFKHIFKENSVQWSKLAEISVFVDLLFSFMWLIRVIFQFFSVNQLHAPHQNFETGIQVFFHWTVQIRIVRNFGVIRDNLQSVTNKGAEQGHVLRI